MIDNCQEIVYNVLILTPTIMIINLHFEVFGCAGSGLGAVHAVRSVIGKRKHPAMQQLMSLGQ
jgi:NifU-like protein involved in Fe-S cluster formation